MKRSTNLFYTVGSDTNFITFSNYGESLTGNFLSVNTKLFPSHFLCLDIPELDNDDEDKTKRGNFIKYIAAYYENKLAFLRDKCVEHDYDVEKKLKPLYYLLEAIEKWCKQNYSITHIGDITEQNYNGTYTDIICVINSSEHYPGAIGIKGPSLGGKDDEEEYDSSTTYLYGWSVKNANGEIYQGPTDYSGISPEFDKIKTETPGTGGIITPEPGGSITPGDIVINPTNIIDIEDSNTVNKCYYRYNTNIVGLTKQSENTDDIKFDIKFNIIIPLYNVTNIDSTSNTSILAESDSLIGTYTQNVPLGIWFSGKEPIVLSRQDTEYDPSWSLLLSSQFKPFPYSDKSPTEIDSSDKTLAFNTFAEIATRQNKLIDKFEDLSNENIKLKKEHQDILSRLKSIGTIDNIDDLCKQITDLKTDLYAKINSLETKIISLETKITSLETQIAELK